jgi:low affinity Fe/Cu permease
LCVTTSSRFHHRARVRKEECFVRLSWAITGPVFQFSDTWQLVLSTDTTIITFLMVLLIQNTKTAIAPRCFSS